MAITDTLKDINKNYKPLITALNGRVFIQNVPGGQTPAIYLETPGNVVKCLCVGDNYTQAEEILNSMSANKPGQVKREAQAQLTLRLSADIVAALNERFSGYGARKEFLEEVLREALNK